MSTVVDLASRLEFYATHAENRPEYVALAASKLREAMSIMQEMANVITILNIEAQEGGDGPYGGDLEMAERMDGRVRAIALRLQDFQRVSRAGGEPPLHDPGPPNAADARQAMENWGRDVQARRDRSAPELDDEQRLVPTPTMSCGCRAGVHPDRQCSVVAVKGGRHQREVCSRGWYK